MRKPFLAGAAMALAGSSLAQPLDHKGFHRMDCDGSGKLSLQEFAQGIHEAGWLAAWDANNNNRVGKAEFRQIKSRGFDEWDADGDGYLRKTEFHASLFEAFDINGSGQISGYEWGVASKKYPLLVESDTPD